MWIAQQIADTAKIAKQTALSYGRLDKFKEFTDIQNKTKQNIALIKKINETLTALNADAGATFSGKITELEKNADISFILNEKGTLENEYLPTQAQWDDFISKNKKSEEACGTLMQDLNQTLDVELKKLDKTKAENVVTLNTVFTAKKSLYPLLSEAGLSAAVIVDQTTLKAWNDAFSEQARAIFRAEKADQKANLVALFEHKKIVAKHLYALEAPLKTLAIDFAPINDAIDSIKNYAANRYENISAYTNIFRRGASRATKLSGALAMCDRMVLNVKGGALSRQGLSGVTHGRLGGVINGFMLKITTFFADFLKAVQGIMITNTTTAPTSSSTTSTLLHAVVSVSSSSSSSNTSNASENSSQSGSNTHDDNLDTHSIADSNDDLSDWETVSNSTEELQPTLTSLPTLEDLKQAVRTREGILQQWKSKYTDMFSSGHEFMFKPLEPGVTLTVADYERKIDITTPRQAYLDTLDAHKQQAVLIEKFEKSMLSRQTMPDDALQKSERDAFRASVKAFRDVLAETACSLFHDKNKSQMIMQLCDWFKDIYKEVRAAYGDKVDQTVISHMELLKKFIEKRYNNGPSLIGPKAQMLELKAAMKCMKSLALTGTIPPQSLQVTGASLLINGDLGKLVRKIQYPHMIDDRSAKEAQIRVYNAAKAGNRSSMFSDAFRLGKNNK